MIHHGSFPAEPWAVRETELRPRRARPDRVGVRALQRAHRPARQPRRGRAARPARHLPERRSTSCGRCPTPRAATAIPSRARRSSTSPTARSSGCSSTTSRSTSATASSRATSGCSTCAPACCAATVEWVSPARTRGARHLDAAGVVHPAGDRGDRLRGRAARRADAASSCSPSWSPTRRCRRPSDDPRAAAALGVAAALAEEHGARRRARCSCTRPSASGLRIGRRDGSRRRRARRAPSVESRAFADVGRADRRPPGSSRASGCGSSSSSPTAGRPSARCRRCATRSRRRWPRRAHTGLGRAARRAARLPRRLLGARRRRGRGRRRAPAGGALRALPRAAGGRARRAARDPGQGADRPRLRRPRLLGHRDLRAAGAHLHRARTPPRDALRWRHSTLDLARERARQLGLRGAAFPWRTIRGEECSGYWPAGTAAFHINADIADAVVRYVAHRRRGVRARRRPRAARRDGAAVALARPPRRGRALPHRRRHRARRVQRDRRQQRLHEPDGAAEPARGGRRGRAPPGHGARELGVDDEEMAALARRGRRRCSSPTTRTLRRAPAGRGLHRARAVGLRRHTGPSSTRCCCTSPTSTSTASRSSSRPTSCSRMHLRGDAFSARAEGAQLRLLRAR